MTEPKQQLSCVECGKTKKRCDFTISKTKNGKSYPKKRCKPCESAYVMKKRKEREGDVNYLYYLPKHNYIGMTSCVQRRMSAHRQRGRNTDGMRVLLSMKSAKWIHLFETILHIAGFDGFHVQRGA